MRKVLLIICLLFVTPDFVVARSKTSCDYTLLSDLKKIASNIDVTYKYYMENDEVYFNITLANLHENTYFVDNNFNKNYYYNDTVDGVITISGYKSGRITYTFYSNDSECFNEKLSTKYINLPYYNYFYNYEECNGIEEFSLCQKWSKNNYGYEEFKEQTYAYKQRKNKIKAETVETIKKNWFEKIVDLYLSYYYIITPIFFVMVIGIMNLIKYIKFKTNRFNI